MRQLLSSLALLAATLQPLRAETPLTGTEFDAATRGQTITYAMDGEVFGTETYLAEGKTVWRFPDQPCLSGTWQARGADLCFAYTGDPEPACWRFFQIDGRLRGILNDASGSLVTLIETARTDTPLACPAAPSQD